MVVFCGMAEVDEIDGMSMGQTANENIAGFDVTMDVVQ